MAKNPVRVILDTNIIISALLFGGKPREILSIVEDEANINAITSSILKAELAEVLTQKFNFSKDKLQDTEEYISDNFELVNPSQAIEILKDKDDNRVLEAAVEGKCQYIITGDRQLLSLGLFKNIKILTSDQFIKSVFKG